MARYTMNEAASRARKDSKSHPPPSFVRRWMRRPLPGICVSQCAFLARPRTMRRPGWTLCSNQRHGKRNRGAPNLPGDTARTPRAFTRQGGPVLLGPEATVLSKPMTQPGDARGCFLGTLHRPTFLATGFLHHTLVCAAVGSGHQAQAYSSAPANARLGPWTPRAQDTTGNDPVMELSSAQWRIKSTRRAGMANSSGRYMYQYLVCCSCCVRSGPRGERLVRNPLAAVNEYSLISESCMKQVRRHTKLIFCVLSVYHTGVRCPRFWTAAA